VKHARRLATRAFRAKTGEFLAEGPQSVREALAVDGVVLEVFATSKYDSWRDDRVEWNTVDESLLAEIADAVTPQGLVARCRSVVGTLDDLPVDADFVVVCADVRDPGNAGAVIRCADAAGADAVVLAGDSVDPLNPKAVRSSAGSLFHLPVVADSDVASTIERLHDRGLQVLAADGSGERDIFDPAVDFVPPTAWLFGNEAWGLPDDIRSRADAVVAVPIFGRAESLNLATAAAVCLYATAWARHSSRST